MFDTDQSGYITRENIVTASQKMGLSITQEELDKIFVDNDPKNTGVLTIDQFKDVLYLSSEYIRYPDVTNNFENPHYDREYK